MLESRLQSVSLRSFSDEKTGAKEYNSPYGVDLKIADEDAANERDIPTREGQPSWSTVQLEFPQHQMSYRPPSSTEQEESLDTCRLLNP